MKKLGFILCLALFYPFVAPRLSYVCRRVRKRLRRIYHTAIFALSYACRKVWNRLKLIYYGAVFVWKTFKVFGFKNGCICAKLVIEDIYNLR